MTPSDVQVIVVDDVQSMRIQIKGVLRSCGFEKIRSANHGIEALQQMNEEPAHLVICDWHMATMSGLDLLREMRKKEKTKDTAFIMLTAECGRERVMEAVQAGLDGYIMKPFTPEQAKLKVMDALLKRRVI